MFNSRFNPRRCTSALERLLPKNSLTCGPDIPNIEAMVPLRGIERERGAGFVPNAVAAPATVSGEPSGRHATGKPGRRRKARTREPGDLPSPWSFAGASSGVISMGDRSGARASSYKGRFPFVRGWRAVGHPRSRGTWVSKNLVGSRRETLRRCKLRSFS